jgi:uncharacterized membrane protein YbhN (UPF0104 family)
LHETDCRGRKAGALTPVSRNSPGETGSPVGVPGTPGKTRKWLQFTLGLLVVAGSFYLLGGRLLRDWHQIPWNEIHLNPPLLALAFGIMFFVWTPLYGLTWKVLLSALGERISLLNSMSVLAVSQMGKYIPGKLWYTVGRMYLARRHGVNEAKTAVSALMETGFSLLGAVVLFGVAVLFLPKSTVPAKTYLAFGLVPFCIIAIYPPVLNRITRIALRLFRQPSFDIGIPFGRLLGILALYVAMWVVQGVGCYVLIRAFYPLPVAKLPMIVGGFALSWILGFVVLISPAGLGVREGVFTFALRLVLPEPVAIISALMSRVWITGAEGILALFNRRLRLDQPARKCPSGASTGSLWGCSSSSRCSSTASTCSATGCSSALTGSAPAATCGASSWPGTSPLTATSRFGGRPC